jgi:hypothetical protein
VALGAASATSLGVALLLFAGGAWCVELGRVSLDDGDAIALVKCPGAGRALRRVAPAPAGSFGAPRWSTDAAGSVTDAPALAEDLVLLPRRVGGAAGSRDAADSAGGGLATAAYAAATGALRFVAPHPRELRSASFEASGYVARGVGGGRVVEVLPYGAPELRALDAGTGATLWRVPLPGSGAPPRPGAREGKVRLRLVRGALEVDGADGRSVHRVRLEDGRAEALGGPRAVAVCPLEGAVVALDRQGFLEVAPLDGGVPTRLGRPGPGSLPACAVAARRLYVVWSSGEALRSGSATGPQGPERAIEDPFTPLGSGSALYAFDAGRFAFGRAFPEEELVAPFPRPDTPPAPPLGEVVEVRLNRSRPASAALPLEVPDGARRSRVDLGTGRFEPASERLVPALPPG